MADVLSQNGYTGTYNSKSVTSIAQELTSAMNRLKYNYIVEFISVSKQNMGSVIIEDGQTVDTSTIVNTPTVKGIQEKQTHIVYYSCYYNQRREQGRSLQIDFRRCYKESYLQFSGNKRKHLRHLRRCISNRNRKSGAQLHK